MSIIPNDANSPEKSTSSLSRSPNPKDNHGLLCSQSPLQHPSRSPHGRHTGRSVGGPELHGISESLVSLGEASSRDPQDVSELRTPDLRTAVVSSAFKSRGYAQEGVKGRGDASSRTRSNQNRSARYSGSVTGSTSQGHSHKVISGPKGPHGNTGQSGTRKNQIVNANHLLNFYYDPVQRSQPRMPPFKRQQKVRPFNRELFLQANYNFVILDTGKYVVESIDPDKMLHWEDIICLRYSTPSPVQCPICLENPLCPQITSCGHIFCFPCILRYLLMGEENKKGEFWKKCPLCFMMISLKDLYTIFLDYVKQINVGDHANFTLMTRPKDSFVPSQVNAPNSDFTLYENDLIGSFSKFTLTSDVEMSVRDAKLSLNEWLAKAECGLVDDLERLPYVCAALEQLDQRMKIWDEHESVTDSPMKTHLNKKVVQPLTKVLSHESSLKVPCAETSDPNTQKIPHKKNGSVKPEVLTFEENQGKALSLNNGEVEQKGSSRKRDVGDKDAYLFYQVVDGQHIVLHPLNMKCLLHHYKSYDLLPPRISGKILQLDTVTQSEATRRRYRYLSHFSLTTTFQICEIGLSDLLPSDAFCPSLDEIKRREKQRKQVARKEFQARSQATVESPMHILSHSRVFNNNAEFALEDFEALGSCASPSTSPPIIGEKKLFADVTRFGFAAAHDSPSLGADSSPDFTSSQSKVEDNTNCTAGQCSSTLGPSTPTLSFANILSQKKTVPCQDAPKARTSEKKGKKPTRVLLSTAGGRRY